MFMLGCKKVSQVSGEGTPQGGKMRNSEGEGE